jgi:Ca2+/Na+ antiporter
MATSSPVPPALRRFTAQPEGPPASDAQEPGRAPQAVRAQLLATEHWSVLATRSTTQSEVLSRITTFLMLVSSSIVGLALIGQVTKFDRRFIALALVLVGILVGIGTLTQMRVGTASLEDLALVIGMNRLRAGYVELDPGIEKYLVTSPHDDSPGVWQTYNPLGRPRAFLQPLASSGSFITFVTSGLAGAFGALVAVAFGAPEAIVGLVAAAAGLAFIGLSAIFGLRQYRRSRRTVLFPARSQQP